MIWKQPCNSKYSEFYIAKIVSNIRFINQDLFTDTAIMCTSHMCKESQDLLTDRRGGGGGGGRGAESYQCPYFWTFMDPRNRFQGMNSASLCCEAGRYDNSIPTRSLAPIDCLKIPALLFLRVYLIRKPVCKLYGNSFRLWLYQLWERWRNFQRSG